MDGVVTGDNDAFLYGAQTVYCDLHANKKALILVDTHEMKYQLNYNFT